MHVGNLGGYLYMCGILGVINYGATTHIQASAYRKAVRRLLEESQVRGTDAAGLFVLSNSNLHMFKNNVSARTLISDSRYSDLMNNIKSTSSFRYAIGHTRCKTKGDQKYNVNNHPIRAGNVIGVHNGNIFNDDMLFREYGEEIKRDGEVDSEIIFRLINYFLKEGLSIIDSVRSTHGLLNGSYACAFITTQNPRYVTLFRDSSTGCISLYISKQTQTMVFASTAHIVKTALLDIKDVGPDILDNQVDLKENGVRIDTMTGKICQFNLTFPSKKSMTQ